MFTFIKMFKTVLEADENNEYANTALAFCAKFVTSFESERTHPILAETFSWLLSVCPYCTFFLLICLSTYHFSDRQFQIARTFDIASVSQSISY